MTRRISPFLALPALLLSGVALAQEEEDIKGAWRVLPKRAHYNALAHRNAAAGALAPWHVKFLVVSPRGKRPRLYFLNSREYPSHYRFVRFGLGEVWDLGDFRKKAYFTDARKWLCGSVVAYDHWTHGKQRGLFAIEYWPADAVGAAQVARCYALLREALPFAKGRLRYHPSGASQVRRFGQEQARFKALGVPVIDTRRLYGKQTYAALNLGRGIGRLRVMSGARKAKTPPTARDIVIYTVAPNELPHVAGVITEEPQTPLSHINLKARQNKTPNAYVKHASKLAVVKRLVGQWVRLRVRPEGFRIERVSQAAADKHWASLRPKRAQRPRRNLTIRDVKPLAEIRWLERHAFGAKTAGVAELRRVGAKVRAPDGWGVPFFFYHRFMKQHGLYARAKRLVAAADFKRDPAVRKARLRAFRKQLRQASVSTSLAAALAKVVASYPQGQPLRCRSSTNNEDLAEFNGAGLYGSRTHRKHEGPLARTIKQVWATLWSYRAFEERSFHRVDHFRTAMGVLIHPNFDQEQANGVAVSKNLLQPAYEGIYVNVQRGEQDSVTNPKRALPDELVVSYVGRRRTRKRRDPELIYLRHSSLVKPGETVLDARQVAALDRAVRAIHAHFAPLYRKKKSDKGWALDIEFKVDAQGRLVFKQARPWID